jgi:hypothetical protein
MKLLDPAPTTTTDDEYSSAKKAFGARMLQKGCVSAKDHRIFVLTKTYNLFFYHHDTCPSM